MNRSRREARDLGQPIVESTTRAPPPEAVRARRAIIKGMLDKLVEDGDKPHILSIAAGGVEIVAATLRQRLAQKIDLSHFDFVSSTGLYHHLHLPTAQRLTSSMFQMLRPRRRHWSGTFSRESKTSDPWIGS